MHARLRPVVKAYDVRGRVPDQLDTTIARALGEAFADEVGIADGGGRAVVGRDMRASSPDVVRAVADGIRSRGADVVDIGLASTDMLYCASGVLDVPGIMVTASHNPAADNGLKLCRAGARPIGLSTGLAAMAEAAGPLLEREKSAVPAPVGTVETLEFLTTYADTLLRLAPVEGRRLKVVVDAGNGMAGHTVPAVLGRLDLEVIGLYLELDGTFPNHEANPLDHTTLVDLQAAVREHGADLGLAFDGDADRCFVIDEHGDVVAPSAITALVASRHLLLEPGATILHNVICSRAVPEIVTERGGVPVRTPVGHSLIKAEMARTGAVFGGEHSGHFYFREFYLADSGMLAALHVLAALAETDSTVSALMAEYSRYSASGEINSRVDDADAVIERLVRAYADHDQDRLDGLTVTAADWWFNVRASNTEPLLRLNVEGADEATMGRVRDEVLAAIRS
ncbi:phosphomannomutase/phosphoglucomutase [Aeromicrobium sp. Leaf291]|uniref:phosphomannomutase/phosphoglucomutase n=1 Tax=Aeromicrobium sp. Leaf291 TaxID=1736325 RepID=UPI0006F337A1|nr:phosphomannomutase/phosphoglucomutase [Aeromicrobium sp. Leaf291]KQP81268.1 phosphoglucosamine mutase [Aeromicrobium sp. Leaf291]